MIIVSTFFNEESQYKRLLNAFYNSVQEHMPGCETNIIYVDFPQEIYGKNILNNHHWETYYAFMTKISRAIEIDDLVLMSDCDIIFTDDMRTAFEMDFDIAITIRNILQKYNTGICFVKPTEKAKQFLCVWKKKTREIAERFNLQEINRYWGIDQASLAATLKEFTDIKIKELPCEIWNAEQTCWKTLNKNVKAIHIKSGLRKIYFGEQQMIPKHNYLQSIIDKVSYYENRVNEGGIKFYSFTTDEFC